jgi:hypothetical protein
VELTENLLNSVAFLSPDDYEIRNVGTGFTVGIPGAVGNIVLYLVTSAQVAYQLDHIPFLIGQNFLVQGKSLIRTRDNYRWWYHPTEAESVDVAVTMFAGQGFSPSDLNFHYVPVSMLATEDRISACQIKPSDSVDAVNLIAQMVGQERQAVSVVSGHISSMSQDRIWSEKIGKNIEAYLVESESILGLGGTPVFAHHSAVASPSYSEGENRNHESSSLSLLGLVHGRLNDISSPECKSALMQPNRLSSAVVPAKKILEVLNHPELIQKRKELDSHFMEVKRTMCHCCSPLQKEE